MSAIERRLGYTRLTVRKYVRAAAAVLARFAEAVRPAPRPRPRTGRAAPKRGPEAAFFIFKQKLYRSQESAPPEVPAPPRGSLRPAPPGNALRYDSRAPEHREPGHSPMAKGDTGAREGAGAMPYRYQNSKGQTYYLHGKEVTLQNGRQQRIFYFAREPKAGEALDALPPGRAVVENPRTGLPFLKGTGAAPAARGPAARGTTAPAGAQRAAPRR